MFDWLRRLFRPKPQPQPKPARELPRRPESLPPPNRSMMSRDASHADAVRRINAMLEETRIPAGFANTMPFDQTIPADLDAILPEARKWH